MKSVLILGIVFLLNLRSEARTIAPNSNQIRASSAWAFEENKGQVTGEDSSLVTYFYRHGDMTMFLMKTGIAYQYEKVHYPEGYKQLTSSLNQKEMDSNRKLEKDIRRETYRMEVELLGANKSPEIEVLGRSSDYIQYYTHNAMDVHAYSKIVYRNVYPNIDWMIYRKGEAVKYDFVVHPGGNPSDIVLNSKWVEKMQLNPDGSLELQNRMGKIIENAPESYQNSDAGVQEIESKFAIQDSIIQIQVEEYDKSKDLIIDPLVRGWATYYGGSANENFASTIADKSGNVYLAGTTPSSDVNLASGGYQNSFGGMLDAILVKFDRDGKRLWATYYGGSGITYGLSCAVTGSNQVYLAGTTQVNGLGTSSTHQPTLNGVQDVFLAKFDSNGVRKWATYYTNACYLFYASCAVDINDNVFLAGAVYDSETSVPYNAQQSTYGGGKSDAFLAKFNSSGTRLWGTYCGGSRDEKDITCTTDPSGNVYLAGSSSSSNNIAINGHQNVNNFDTFSSSTDSLDAFLVKYNGNGTRQWGTFYGGFRGDLGKGCSTDKQGNVYLTGTTYSSSLISYNGHLMTNVYQSKKMFLVKFNSTGVRQWATYYGEDTCSTNLYGIRGTLGSGCATDDSNNVYICGENESFWCNTIGVAYNGFKNTFNNLTEQPDAILAKFAPDGTRVWGTWYGSIRYERGRACCVDKFGHVYLAGLTQDTNRISYNGFQNSTGGGVDHFLVKFCGRFDTPMVVITGNQGSNVCAGSQAKFTAKPFFGGTKPSYSWRKNGTTVGTDTSVYLSSTLADNDTIQCLLKSNASCLYIDSAWSNKIIVKLKSSDSTYLNQSTCANQPFNFNGQNLTTTGLYRDTLVSKIGCDSFIFLNLTVNPTSTSSYAYTLNCNQSSYFFNNQNLSNSGVYKDTLMNAAGCDSFITLNLTVNKPTSSSLSQSICSNQSYLFNNMNLKLAGIYKDTLVNFMGCDSIITLNLSLNPNSASGYTQAICQGQSYFFNGQNRTLAGQYRDTLVNSIGCDSIITLTLTYLTNPAIKINNITACNPYTYKGMTYSSSAIVIDTLKSNFGCDSVYLRNMLNIKPIAILANEIKDTFCDEIFIKNQIHKSSFVYTDTVRTKDNLKCDSIYQPRNVTIIKTPELSISSSRGLNVEKGEKVALTSSPVKNYLWNTGESSNRIEFKIVETSTYYVIGWNEDLCKDTAAIILTAVDPARLEFPNAFAPFSDSFSNRIFRPNYFGNIELIKFEIYNRIGEKMFATTDLSNAWWDGIFKGELQPGGIYSYIIDYRANRIRKFKTGEFLLSR